MQPIPNQLHHIANHEFFDKGGMDVVRTDSMNRNEGELHYELEDGVMSNIRLSDFDDPEIELLVFLHEVGHGLILYDRLSLPQPVTYALCPMSNEGAAWERALIVASKWNITWSINALNTARRAMISYLGNIQDTFKLTSIYKPGDV